MNTQLRTATNPSTLSSIGHDFHREERRARHAELRDLSIRRSEYELFCWKQLSNVPKAERERAYIPTFRMWEMFFQNGGHHA